MCKGLADRSRAARMYNMVPEQTESVKCNSQAAFVHSDLFKTYLLLHIRNCGVR